MKKVISLFTAIVMLFASVVTTIPAAASSDLSSQEYELQVKAENSLGSLLADALLDESESDENKDGFTGYCIGGAEVSGNTVTIDYCAIEDCTIIAALYDDSGENMLMSGNAEVSASERQTTVTISGTMPDYFLLKVYPVDETTLRPLGPEYVNSDHTKAFQEAWAKTTNDFPEELVLNIDDNSDTNFFVHNEEVERVDYVEGVNIVASADFDNNVYVIENADSTFTSLKPGDKLSYIYGDNQIILTLVDSIDINGTTVTVRGAEAHLDDFFDHFQINCESECADVEVVEGTEGDGVTYLGRYGDLQNSTYTLSEDNEVTVSSMMLAGGYSSDPEEYFKTPIAPGSLTFEAEIDKGSFEFTLDLGGDFRIMYDYQIENGKKVDEIWDVRLEVTYDMAVKIGVECKVDEEIKLAEFVLFSFYGINLEVIPKIPYEISGAASVEFRFVGGRVGFQDMYLGEMGGGNHVQCPLNMDPDFAIDVDLEVTIKIGMEFDMAVCFICSDIAKLALSIGAEFVIEASYSGTVFSLAPDELNPPVKHDCGNDCISISAKWGPTVKFTATLFDLNDLSLEYELPIMGEDYYIPVADAYISLKYADAGFGECPHKSYRVDLFLNNSDPENSVVNGASITCEGETKNISSGNHAVFYLHSGMHRFDISVPELESTEEYYVYVDDSPTRCEAFIQYPAKTYTLEFTYPDGSAAAGESVYISNSYAGITDNNGRLDTELCVGKTYSFVTLMSGKGYSDPGKIRIPDINFTGNLQITVYRDGSERPADVQEIEKPWSAIVMVDDVYGEPVSGAGLTINGLGSFTTNKLGVAHIDVPDNNTYYGTAAKTGHLNTRFAIEAGIETVYVRLVKKANDPSDFEYTISNDEVTVTGYKGGSPCAVIPSEIEGCPVTALGSFTCSTVLEELVMPNSVTTIATSGFTSCKDLKKVLFSDSITSIPNYAFSNLTELTDISLPDNLLAIGEYAFSGCTGLKTVDLPEGLTTLSKKSFGSCTGIKSVYIPSTITGVNEYGSGTVPYGPFTDCVSLKSVEFGAGITTIPEYLFYNCIGLEEIDIPDTVTEIKGDAFRGTSIEELYLPEGLETLNLNSFGSCSNLRLVHIPSTLKEVKNISYGSAMVYYGPFSNCGALKEVTFGNGITTIPRFLFYNTGIEKITIPNTVTTIEVKAFGVCDQLYDVTLSNRLEEIGESAFNDCDILGSIDLPAGLTSIGKGAFYSCKALGSIELPADLVTLGENAFGYCTSLVSVNIPASLTTTYTGNGPFWNCSALKNVTFDQGISEIPDNLFNQTGLESVVIPNTVTKIGNYSFYKNTKLVSVTIPASVNEIGRYAFSSTGITELYLPEGVQSLGGSAFENCTSLETAHIPSTLTTINIPSGSYAPFWRCSALKNVTFGSGISEIPDKLFYNTGLESVVIPDSVTTIGDYSFSTSTLTAVYIPASVESISTSAFSSCTGLTIYGEMNSYAETFASEKNITFVVGSIPETAAVNSAVVTYEMQSGEELRYTANFTDLDANRIYNFYVMKDRYAQQPFAADNLLYISQHTSDENGVISVTYYPTEVCEDCDIFVVRMRLYDISSANISVADLTYTGERQFADPVVTFDGVELEEGIDYNLKGDFSATEIGTYNMEIVGTGDYYHSTFTSYSILEPEISSIEVTTLPETTEYMLNEELDITGAELTVNYVNNTAKKLSITADMVTGFDSTSVGDKTLTVTYGGQTATFVITVKAVGEFDHALDYTDNIGLVFYMKLGEDILSDDSAEMVFSLNGKTVKVPVAEAAPATVNDDTVYAFTCPVSAAEMADDIQAQIVTNDYESDTFTYSILQYVSDRYTDFRDGEHESGELAEYNAIAAMLNYGAAAQEYFGHNTETLANSCLDPSDRNVSSINAGTLSSNRYLITDIKHTKIFRGLVIALKDQVSIKLYFSKNGLSLDDFTVTTGGESIDPSLLSVTCDESDTILEISDIGAGDLGESFTVTIGDVTISNISVLSYAQQVLSTDIEELSDIATALVNYNNCVITAKQCENAA